MSPELLTYAGIFLFGVFISSVAQVLLKKAAMRSYASRLREYLNPLVITAYTIFLLSTLLTMLAYRVVPLSLGPILEATSYVYVTAFGVLIFKERLTPKRVVALGLIVVGIAVYSCGV